MRFVERTPCCQAPKSRCGTRFEELRRWVFATSGKGVKVVSLQNHERGRSPFFAQPVGFDGRNFLVSFDHGCDTEKLLHEVCHWLVAPKARRNRINYGLGPGDTPVPYLESDNEEVTVMLLERLLAPVFGLAEQKIAKPDYNVEDRRNVDWDACEERASTLFEGLSSTLVPQALRAAGS